MKGDQKKTLQYLKTARGQLDGVIKMIEEDRYCIDISNQLLAIESLVQKANQEVLKGHLHHCVKEAFETGNGNEKIDEIVQLISKMTK